MKIKQSSALYSPFATAIRKQKTAPNVVLKITILLLLNFSMRNNPAIPLTI
jgi:hypothetical protein